MSGRAAPLGALVLFACGSGTAGPVFPTSERFPETPRVAPSFAAEPAFGAPAINAEPAGRVSIRTARVPLDSEAARELVSRFFSAVLQESTKDLLPLMSAHASVVSEGSRQPAQSVWRARFAQLDYTGLTGRVVAAPQTLRTYTFDSAARAKLDGVPAPASPSEVVVVARPGVGATWAGKARLFGDSMAFRLRERPSDDSERGFEITEITEDFRLP